MLTEGGFDQNKKLFRQVVEIVKLAQDRDPKLSVEPIMGYYTSWRFAEVDAVRTNGSLSIGKTIADLGGVGNRLASLHYSTPDSPYYPDLYTRGSGVRTRFRLKVGQLTDELTSGLVEKMVMLNQLEKGNGADYTVDTTDFLYNETDHVDTIYMIGARKMRMIVSFPRSIPDARPDFNPGSHLKQVVIDPNPGDYELVSLVLARLQEDVSQPPAENWQYLEAIMKSRYNNF